MKALFVSIFGAYVPVTYERVTAYWDEVSQTFYEVTEDVIPDGFAGVDWSFVLSAIVFIVTLYSVLRIIGAVINRV